jgi:Carboxypeptidase regulatory-like domain
MNFPLGVSVARPCDGASGPGYAKGVSEMSSRVLLVVVACTLALGIAPRAKAQATANFSGTVVDKSGAAVAGATVRAISQDTGAVREAKTDDSGHYVIPLMPRGNYTIHVEFQGFQPAENKDIVLQVDEHREVDFTLALASVSSQVLVEGTPVAVETGNATLGQVITSQEVAELPLNGRDFVQLAILTPGATTETNPNSFFTQGASSEVAARGSYSLSVGGSRPNSTDWLLDGVDDNELTAGGVAIFSSIDSIQEFKVLTYNYSAQFGTRAGPTVLVTTKSGSNQFHGSLFEFLRNTDLDARSYFSSSTEKFNLNQFGGALGGPIRKDKTFFFIDVERKDQREGIPFAGVVPTTPMLSGDFSKDPFGNPTPIGYIVNPNTFGSSNATGASPNAYFQCDSSGNPLPAAPNGVQAAGVPCNKIPSSLINNIGQALIDLYPAPTPGLTSTSYNYASDPVRKLDETKFDVKLNQNFSAQDSALARFSYDQADSYVPGGAPGFAEQNAYASNQGIINHARNVAIGETHIFSPSTVNQLIFGYNRIFDYITSQGTGSCSSSTLVPGGIIGSDLGCGNGTSSSSTCVGYYSCGLVSVSLPAPYFDLGDRGFTPFQGGTDIFSIGDSLDMVRGKHDLRAGIDIRVNEMNVGTTAYSNGIWGVSGGYSGNPFADLLMGIVGSEGIHDQAFNGPVTGRRWNIYRPYVQDDWRVSNELTLNLGIAWDMTTPISEAHGRQADFIPSTGTLLVANQGGVNSAAGIQMNWTAFEPRIGVAWRPFGRDKTAVRGGYAIFHDSAWSMGAQGLWQNPPFFAESDQFPPGSGCVFMTSFCATPALSPAVDMSSGFPLITTPPTPATFQGSFLNEPTNMKLGRVQQFNADFEQEVPGQVVLTVGYAGSRGAHILMYGNDLNTAGPSACGVVSGYTIGCGPNGAAVPLPYPNFPYNAIFAINDAGATSYDSLQIKAETKSARYGLYALIGYTYSHTYDDGLSDGLGSVLSAPYFPLPNWQKLDWALSQIDLDHSFTASVIYDLPFGRGKKFGSDWNKGVNALLGNWELGLIEKITSGFPVPLIDSLNLAGNIFENGGDFDNFNRPNQVAGCDPYAANHGMNQWLNPACFPAPSAGELGDASRVPVFGPDFVNTDFSVIKRFALPWENVGLDFRSEFFNLFNHAQFGMPLNDINPNVGGFGDVVSTVNNPRLIQFALKLTF